MISMSSPIYSAGDRWFGRINLLLLAIFAICTLYPLVYVFSLSNVFPYEIQNMLSRMTCCSAAKVISTGHSQTRPSEAAAPELIDSEKT